MSGSLLRLFKFVVVLSCLATFTSSSKVKTTKPAQGSLVLTKESLIRHSILYPAYDVITYTYLPIAEEGPAQGAANMTSTAAMKDANKTTQGEGQTSLQSSFYLLEVLGNSSADAKQQMEQIIDSVTRQGGVEGSSYGVCQMHLSVSPPTNATPEESSSPAYTCKLKRIRPEGLRVFIGYLLVEDMSSIEGEDNFTVTHRHQEMGFMPYTSISYSRNSKAYYSWLERFEITLNDSQIDGLITLVKSEMSLAEFTNRTTQTDVTTDTSESGSSVIPMFAVPVLVVGVLVVVLSLTLCLVYCNPCKSRRTCNTNSRFATLAKII